MPRRNGRQGRIVGKRRMLDSLRSHRNEIRHFVAQSFTYPLRVWYALPYALQDTQRGGLWD
jgi:hypothetical protein